MPSAKFPEPLMAEPVKQRRCLRCNHYFKSTGISNRICGPCNVINLTASRRTSHETDCGRRLIRNAVK